MSCGIKSPGCEPPFCLGTGGWCGCNCGCIPPCPVYTELAYKFPCGNILEMPIGDYYIQACTQSGYSYCPIEDVIMPFDCAVIVGSCEGSCSGFDEYLCTSGGWVKTLSGCTSPCRSNDPALYYTCDSESIGAVVEMDCTCPATVTDYYDIKVSFDGCGLYPNAIEPNCGKVGSFKVVGKGTITSDGPITITCSEGGESQLNLLFNGETSLEVEDCDEVEITIDWSGDPCCPCCGSGVMKTTEAEYCGSTITDYCDTCITSLIAKRKRIHLKNSVLSRIKKVHYKP
jgi:hypothetical protein